VKFNEEWERISPTTQRRQADTGHEVICVWLHGSYIHTAKTPNGETLGNYLSWHQARQACETDESSA